MLGGFRGCGRLAAGAAQRAGARAASHRAVAMPKHKKGETHTGAAFAKDDYKRLRFVGGKTMEVNKRWAKDLIASVPATHTEKRIVSCDGGGGALGHPKVYINLDPGHEDNCPYCGLKFVHDGHH